VSIAVRRRRGPIISLAIVVVVLVGLLFGATVVRQLALFEPASAGIGSKFADEGNAHVPDGQKVTYGATPPTSGAHWAIPAPWGISEATLPDERTTHNLEHGGIVIDYSGLSTDDLSKLKTLVRSLLGGAYPKVILQPYPKLTDEQIALSAWTWQLKLTRYDETQILKFLQVHYQGTDAPEPNAN
jgi:hypothetical protein